MKNSVKLSILCLILLVILIGCSDSSTNPIIKETRSFITNENFEYFINFDRSVNIKITGEFSDGNETFIVNERGFVFGLSSMPEVNKNNTVVATGANPVYGNLRNLTIGETFFMRGFFAYIDGSYFYGEEKEINTNIDASNSRILVMEMKSELFFQNSEGMTPELVVTKIEMESPIEIGFEYSINEDFSDSSITLDSDLSGNVWQTSYSEFIEELAPGTIYYFKPYAKYADGKTTNGGDSVVAFKKTN